MAMASLWKNVGTIKCSSLVFTSDKIGVRVDILKNAYNLVKVENRVVDGVIGPTESELQE